jgi:hypothetical protein
MPEPTNKKVVTFGGTGKTVALIYVKLCRIIGYQPNVIIVDFPAGEDPNANDGQLDNDLAQEADGSIRRISTLPDNRPLTNISLLDMFGLPHEVADALFTEEQQSTPPNRGLNAEPQVGACVTHFKLREDGQAVRSALLTGEPDLFFVAGLGGGTGAGVTHHFARFVSNVAVSRHGVFLLPWRDIGSIGTVTNAQQMRNAASVLSYLKDNGDQIYDDTVFIGGLPGMGMYKSGDGDDYRATHPSLILAALYLLLHQVWGDGAQLTLNRRRLESATAGISLEDIATPTKGKNLYDMLVLSRRKVQIMEYLAREDPDQVLCRFSLAPLSQALACMPLCWLLKVYARKVSQGDYSAAWGDLKQKLIQLAEIERKSLEWIVNLASDRRVFKFDSRQLERDSSTNYREYLEQVKASTDHRDFALGADKAAEALDETAAFMRETIHKILLRP